MSVNVIGTAATNAKAIELLQAALNPSDVIKKTCDVTEDQEMSDGEIIEDAFAATEPLSPDECPELEGKANFSFSGPSILCQLIFCSKFMIVSTKIWGLRICYWVLLAVVRGSF